MTARRSGDSTSDAELDRIQGARLEPIGTVERELTRPDGSKVIVEVPVYPPFRLEERKPARPPERRREAPRLRNKPRSRETKRSR